MKKKFLHLCIFLAGVILAGLMSLNAAENHRQASSGRHGPPPPNEVASHLFELYDSDNNEYLSGLEIGEVAKEMLEHRPPSLGQQQEEPSISDEDLYELEDRLMNYDLNDDSALSKTELVSALEAMAPSRPERESR